MAVDTAAKRYSMLGFSDVNAMPAPDGTIAASDRLALLDLYSGISATIPATAHDQGAFELHEKVYTHAVREIVRVHEVKDLVMTHTVRCD